jgi:hypothetical protein
MLKALTHSKEANYYENLIYRYSRCLVKSKLAELNCKAGEGSDDIMVSIVETNTSSSSAARRDLK